MSVVEILKIAGMVGAVVGALIIAVTVVVMVLSLNRGPRRQRAYAFALVGAAVMMTSSAVYLVSRLGQTLPIVAGIPVIVFLLILAFALRVAARKALSQIPHES